MPISQRVALYPGSFDPLTLGHEDIARRALAVADRLIIAVAHSPSQPKQGLFSIPERLEIIREVFADVKEIEAAEFTGLVVDFARRIGATLIVRGLRGVADFEYEFQMSRMNRTLHPGLETIFLTPGPETSFISASLVREISSLGGDVGRFVSAPVLRRLRDKHSGKAR